MVFQMNCPRSIYVDSNTAPRFSGHFLIIGLVVLVFKSLLGIASQWSREKFRKNCNFHPKASWAIDDIT